VWRGWQELKVPSLQVVQPKLVRRYPAGGDVTRSDNTKPGAICRPRRASNSFATGSSRLKGGQRLGAEPEGMIEAEFETTLSRRRYGRFAKSWDGAEQRCGRLQRARPGGAGLLESPLPGRAGGARIGVRRGV